MQCLLALGSTNSKVARAFALTKVKRSEDTKQITKMARRMSVTTKNTISTALSSSDQSYKGLGWAKASSKFSAVTAFSSGIAPHSSGAPTDGDGSSVDRVASTHDGDDDDGDHDGEVERLPSLLQQVWTGSFFEDVLNRENRDGRGAKTSNTADRATDGTNDASKRGCLERAIKSKVFTWFIMLTILVNAVFLGLDHYPQTDRWSDMLRIANYVFVAIFVVEMVLKIATLGCTRYAKKIENCYDWFVTVAGIVELLVVEVGNVDNTISIMAFRSFRLLRILRLSKDWDNLRNYAAGAVRAFRALGSLMALIGLFLVITSLVGMQLFGGKYW